MCNSQLSKLKTGVKNGIEVTLNLSSNMVGDSNNKTNFYHKLLITDTQVSRLLQMVLFTSLPGMPPLTFLDLLTTPQIKLFGDEVAKKAFLNQKDFDNLFVLLQMQELILNMKKLVKRLRKEFHKLQV